MARRPSRRSEEFSKTWKCEDNAFLEACGFQPGTDEATAALAIRGILSDLGNVSPNSICPRHTFRKELVGLAMLDSLDTVEFVMRLEDSLNIRMPTAIKEKLLGLSEQERADPSFTVADMVTRLVTSLKRLDYWPQRT